MNKLLSAVNVAHSVLGPWPLEAISGALNRWSGHMVPSWNRYMPKVCVARVGIRGARGVGGARE